MSATSDPRELILEILEEKGLGEADLKETLGLSYEELETIDTRKASILSEKLGSSVEFWRRRYWFYQEIGMKLNGE